jgi:general L-amino acid transport system permease protein
MTIRTIDDTPGPRATGGSAIWWNRRFRAYLLQAFVLAIVALVIWFFAHNASLNMGRQRMTFGFGFLSREAGFGIGETLIAYSSQSSFGRAFLAGLVNTVTVSAYALVLTTIIGFAVGIGSLSSNGSLRRVCLTYVALFRNVPLLLQLYLWYSIATGLLPAPAEAWNILGVQISRVGIFAPTLLVDASLLTGSIAAAAAVAAGIATSVLVLKRGIGLLSLLTSGLAAVVAGLVLLLLTGGATVEPAQWQRFRFIGGIKYSPEFAALLIGLAIYTASFIAEIVRAGIIAVKKGQKEAGQALGLTPGQTLRYIVIPQAARVIIPPLTSQYLNLVKNSSLAVAIGYPDLVSIGNTTLNITGRAIECVAIMMAVYLSLSLAISAAMNVYNKKMALRTR